jgi:hypothetical protein
VGIVGMGIVGMGIVGMGIVGMGIVSEGLTAHVCLLLFNPSPELSVKGHVDHSQGVESRE